MSSTVTDDFENNADLSSYTRPSAFRLASFEAESNCQHKTHVHQFKSIQPIGLAAMRRDLRLVKMLYRLDPTSDVFDTDDVYMFCYSSVSIFKFLLDDILADRRPHNLAEIINDTASRVLKSSHSNCRRCMDEISEKYKLLAEQSLTPLCFSAKRTHEYFRKRHMHIELTELDYPPPANPDVNLLADYPLIANIMWEEDYELFSLMLSHYTDLVKGPLFERILWVCLIGGYPMLPIAERLLRIPAANKHYKPGRLYANQLINCTHYIWIELNRESVESTLNVMALLHADNVVREELESDSSWSLLDIRNYRTLTASQLSACLALMKVCTRGIYIK